MCQALLVLGAWDGEGGAHLFLFCIEAHAFGNVFPTLVTPDVEGHFKPAMQLLKILQL